MDYRWLVALMQLFCQVAELNFQSIVVPLI